MGGKKKGVLRSVVDTAKKPIDSASRKAGLGGLGNTLFTFANPGNLALEAGAMGEDMVRAPALAKEAAKKALSAQQAEQRKLLGAARDQAANEATVAAATEDLARKKAKQQSKGSGRQSTILTNNQTNNVLGNSGDAKTILGV